VNEPFVVRRSSFVVSRWSFVVNQQQEVQMIKAIIFDIGGVLIRTPDRSSRRRWEEKLGLAEWESEEIVFSGEMGTLAQSGAVTDVALWQWVGQRLKLTDAELAEFKRDFWAGDVLDTALVAYIRSLRPSYQTAVISNATDGLQQALTDTYPIADAFDLIVCSATEKVMKPDAEIYRRTLQQLGRRPEEAVFIDDNAANIATARDLGLHTVHFKPATNVPVELARLGVQSK
jgi:glucose-1-phosphatase